MQILGQIGLAVGGFPKCVKYNAFCDFLTVFIVFLDPLHTSIRGSGAQILSTRQSAVLVHTLNGSNDVFPRKEVSFWG